jgi:hypothetical protein
MRVLDGLEGAAAQTGSNFSRQKVEATLAALGTRVFLMNNVHEDGPAIFQTRWALSYLRGPLTRSQIQTLTRHRKSLAAAQTAQPSGPTGPEPPEASPPAPAVVADKQPERPILPPDLRQKFLVAAERPIEAPVLYRPALYAIAALHFVRAGYGTDVWEDRALLALVSEGKRRVPWQDPENIEPDALDLADEPDVPCEFATLPVEFTRAGIGASLERALQDALYRSETVTLWKCEMLGEYSSPGEEEGRFRARLGQHAREQRDRQIDKLRQRYASKLGTLKRRIQAAQERIDREKAQADQATLDTAVSFGSSLIGALFGRKLASRANVGRAATSVRSAGRAARQRGDVQQAQSKLESLQQELAALEHELEEEVHDIEAALHADAFDLETLEVRPRKSDIRVKDITLVWTPWLVTEGGAAVAAYQLQTAEKP